MASAPLAGSPSEDSLLGKFWIVVIVGGFFVFAALLLSVSRLEELVRREAWVPPGAAEHPVPVAIALTVMVMAATAGFMLAFMWVVQLFVG